MPATLPTSLPAGLVIDRSFDPHFLGEAGATTSAARSFATPMAPSGGAGDLYSPWDPMTTSVFWGPHPTKQAARGDRRGDRDAHGRAGDRWRVVLARAAVVAGRAVVGGGLAGIGTILKFGLGRIAKSFDTWRPSSTRWPPSTRARRRLSSSSRAPVDECRADTASTLATVRSATS